MQMRINNPNHQPNQESANTIVLECTTVRHQDSVVSVPGELLSATEERCWDVPNPSCIIQWNTCCEAGISSPTFGEKPHHANSDFTQVQVGPLLEASPSTPGRAIINSHSIFPHLQSLIPERFSYSGYIMGLGTHLGPHWERSCPLQWCSHPALQPQENRGQPRSPLPGQSPGSSPRTEGMWHRRCSLLTTALIRAQQLPAPAKLHSLLCRLL